MSDGFDHAKEIIVLVSDVITSLGWGEAEFIKPNDGEVAPGVFTRFGI